MPTAIMHLTGKWALERGSTYTLAMTWRNRSTRQPYALAGWSGEMVFRKSFGDDAPVLIASTGNGQLTLGSGEENIKIEIPSAVLSALPADVKQGVYDLTLTDTFNKPHKKTKGRFVLSPDA